jgi:coenzyme F420-0:L-glutamate ligase/coenzyme F420-1:gamma-L-glutamate ligase
MGLDGALQVLPVRGIGEVAEGADLGQILVEALDAQGTPPRDGDILVVTQKIVSKAEGRLVRLDDVQPSALAVEWATRWNKDARVTEVVLREAQRIVRMDRGVIICETKHGFVCANAGVDASNVASGVVALLPIDPDASAEQLRRALEHHAGASVGIIISDTFGRAWREGQTNVAIGVAGVEALRDFSGQVDPTGYELRVTAIATADELAGAAELVMGKLDRVPVALVRGLGRALADGSSRHLVRPAATDLFR